MLDEHSLDGREKLVYADTLPIKHRPGPLSLYGSV